MSPLHIQGWIWRYIWNLSQKIAYVTNKFQPGYHIKYIECSLHKAAWLFFTLQITPSVKMLLVPSMTQKIKVMHYISIKLLKTRMSAAFSQHKLGIWEHSKWENGLDWIPLQKAGQKQFHCESLACFSIFWLSLISSCKSRFSGEQKHVRSANESRIHSNSGLRTLSRAVNRGPRSSYSSVHCEFNVDPVVK